MTQRELEQLRDLKSELKADRRRLRELTGVTGSITGLPCCISVKEVDCFEAELTALREQINFNVRRCLYEIARATEFINSIGDSQLRQIFTYRYICGSSWQQVAWKIGEADEQYPRRKHNEYLAKINDSEKFL